MSIINEELARRSKENMSFSDYKAGSATSEYHQECARVKGLIESAKLKVSDQAKERLDNLYNWYCSKYASWTNNHNKNGSNHVSVMISGPSNYNMRAHEKFMNRERKLWEEYDQLKDIEYKIGSIVTGDKIIKSDDADAVEKLQSDMKAVNAILRKKKLTDAEKVDQIIKLGFSDKNASKLLQPGFCCQFGFASYQLTNNNAAIRTAKKRLEKIQREREQVQKKLLSNLNQ